MIKFIFWFSAFVLMYIYLGYPLIIYFLAKIKPLPVKQDDTYLPTVALIISAYNEEKVIREKLENSLSLDYPRDKIEIWVVSDASSDQTDAIVKSFKKENIKLFRLQNRKGKTFGITKVMEQINTEIVIFSDANSIYENNAIKELVKFFAEPSVGYVVGKAMYLKDKTVSPAGASEGMYWKYELFLKELESQFHSVVGGDGAIYAIRRELFDPLDEDDINDFVNPLQIIAKGYRGIFNPKAICYEYASNKFEKEYKRKRRIVNRSWRALKKYFHLFKFKKHGKFLFLLFSHKVIRWFNWVFLIIFYLLLIYINLISPTLFYKGLLIFSFIFILFSLIGYWFDKKNKNVPLIFYLPYYYHLINLAAFKAFIDDLKGEKYIKWEHIRSN